MRFILRCVFFLNVYCLQQTAVSPDVWTAFTSVSVCLRPETRLNCSCGQLETVKVVFMNWLRRSQDDRVFSPSCEKLAPEFYGKSALLSSHVLKKLWAPDSWVLMSSYMNHVVYTWPNQRQAGAFSWRGKVQSNPITLLKQKLDIWGNPPICFLAELDKNNSHLSSKYKATAGSWLA